VKRVDLDLTFIVRKEGSQYSSLCLELDVASCGRTRGKAVQALKDAVETYVQYMIEEGRVEDIYRPVPPEALHEFLFGEGEESGLRTFNALPIEYSYGLGNSLAEMWNGFSGSLG